MTRKRGVSSELYQAARLSTAVEVLASQFRRSRSTILNTSESVVAVACV